MASTVFSPYKNEGRLVDRKGYNLHISGMVESASGKLVAAGTSGFSYTTGNIPAGAICAESHSVDATATDGQINVAKGGAGEVLIGVAIEERNGGDVRPIALTWMGYVRLVAGTGGVTKGDFLCADTVSGYYGCAITWADVVDTAANSLAAKKKVFGKALTSAGVGEYFDAFVNFAGV
jgi:hypothetical protein